MPALPSSPTRACLLFTLAWPAAALAHSTDEAPTLATAWTLSPWLLVPLAVFVAGHAWGLVRMWRRAGWGRGLGPGHAFAFVAGALALALATIWPFDALGEWSLAAHMAQHMLLLAVAPPLLLAARPLPALAGVFPAAARWFHRCLKSRWAGSLDRLAPAAALHSVVMWAWHLPSAIALALASEPVHWLMHGSFLVAGIWFWAVVLHRWRDPAAGAGPALVALVTVMMQMGLMGALLTFGARPLYADYVLRAPKLGLDALADQQLAGLLMWVPACLPYLLAAVWLLWRALERDAARPPPGT